VEEGIGLLTLIAMAYFLPWLIALARSHHNAGAIFVFNLLLGWTMLGWVIALVWSMTSVQRRWDGAMVATIRPGPRVSIVSDVLPNGSFGFFITVLFFLLIIIFVATRAHASPMYRGNAAPGMMNSGPEAGYFNRARPPVPLISPYRTERGPYVRPFEGGAIIEPPYDLGPRGSPEGAPARVGPVPDSGRVVLHNGSLMRVVMTPDGYMDIFYVRPRPGLPVLPGVRLLRGQWDGPPPQNFVAVAFVFPPYPCPPVPYGVRGVVDQSDTLVLFGPAPIVAPGCRVIGHDWTRNSELRFEQVRP
jgi:hypothetical protein